MCCLVYVGLFVSVKHRQLLLAAWQIFKEYFHSALWILKCKFHAQSESQKGEFKVQMCVYTHIGFFGGSPDPSLSPQPPEAPI